MSTVLVMGVRGKTGRQVAQVLARSEGITIRGGGRDVSATPPSPGIDAVRLDWEDRDSWKDAIEGVDAVYIVKPRTPDPSETVASFLEGADSVKRIVLLSEIDAGRRDPTAMERKVEKVVEASRFDWAILRPNWFMQNFTEPSYYLGNVRDAGELSLPTGGQATSVIDTRDIAAVAANCLLDSRHSGHAYTLTGPDPLNWHEMAAMMGEAAGHEVRHDDVPLEAFLSAAARDGASSASTEYYRRVYGAIQQGGTAIVSPDVERVTGQPPRSFSAFVSENKDLWLRTTP